MNRLKARWKRAGYRGLLIRLWTGMGGKWCWEVPNAPRGQIISSGATEASAELARAAACAAIDKRLGPRA